MDFRLVDTGWDKVLRDALFADSSSVRIVCPYIKRSVAERLLQQRNSKRFEVITRFNLGDFVDGVSDISALRLLLNSGAQVRGVRNLHAKVYLFGLSRVVVTSANLTDAALTRNHEFGFVSCDPEIANRCHDYFNDLWRQSGPDLSCERLGLLEEKVAAHLAAGASQAKRNGLGDEGVDVGQVPEPVVISPWVSEAPQGFVKFLGEGHDRVAASMQTLEEVKAAGCHWACAYPKNKRPRSVRDGAVVFMGRLTTDPHDIFVFGRAIGMQHLEERDDATPADVALRSWKAIWPHYIRVHHAEFVSGSLSNGVSLNKLMNELKSNAFASTQRNAANASGNTDPRQAYRQQAAVELTSQAQGWLNEELDRAFAQHGRIPSAEIEKLDWPTIPPQAYKGGS